MQPRDRYEPDDSSSRSGMTGYTPVGNRTVHEENLIRENERLRNAQARSSTVAEGRRLARENERLRGEQAYRDSAGAVGGLVLGVLVFALAVLGIGAFFIWGREPANIEPQQAQPEAPQGPDININVPQPPPITVEPPPQQRINVEVAPPTVINEAPTPPAIETPAEAPATQEPVTAPPATN